MNINLNYISVEQALRFNEILSSHGVPSENKVLILSPTGETKSGSIIIPGNANNSKPKKGVIIQISSITEDEAFLKKILKVGSIITYGLYAGKELSGIPFRLKYDVAINTNGSVPYSTLPIRVL